MKAIKTGFTYNIYDDSMETFESLPAKYYNVRFSDKSGFYLEEYDGMKIKEGKIYGARDEKVRKVMRSFGSVDRSLGVILSGEKGTGKSLFGRMLGEECIKSGIPVIIVSEAIPDIANYIDRITQEVMIFFDEFDKTFRDKNGNGNSRAQVELLSLFDGISSNKKLFVITCNSIIGLNEFFINRPGRFHYHIRFDQPDLSEVEEYLTDNVIAEYHDQIKEVVKFSARVPLSYDALRAIAFELNTGESFLEAIKDMNILNTERIFYQIRMFDADGKEFGNDNGDFALDMFSNKGVNIGIGYHEGYSTVDILINPSTAEYNMENNCYTITSDNFTPTFNIDEDDSQAMIEKFNKLKEIGIDRVEIIPQKPHSISYSL